MPTILNSRCAVSGTATEVPVETFGKTYAAVDLAVKLARAGKRVVLFERDDSRVEVAKCLGLLKVMPVESLSLSFMAPDAIPRGWTFADLWRNWPGEGSDVLIVNSLHRGETVGMFDNLLKSWDIAVVAIRPKKTAAQNALEKLVFLAEERRLGLGDKI